MKAPDRPAAVAVVTGGWCWLWGRGGGGGASKAVEKEYCEHTWAKKSTLQHGVLLRVADLERTKRKGGGWEKRRTPRGSQYQTTCVLLYFLNSLALHLATC